MKLEVTGIQKVQEKLEGIKSRLRDLTPVLQVASEDLKKLASDAFKHGDAPASGIPWSPLQPSTIAKKAKARKTRTLVWSGTLRNSVNTTINAKDGSVLIGTNVPYGKFHQFGTSKMDARPFLPSANWQDGSPQAVVMLKIYARVRNFILNGKTSPAKA